MNKKIKRKAKPWGRIIHNYPIDLIQPAYVNHHNPRLDPEKPYQALEQAIAQWGVIGTIPVTPLYKNENGEQVYEIIDGDRTYVAAKRQGVKTLNIIVYEGKPSEIDAMRLALNRDSEISEPDMALYIYNVLVKKHKLPIVRIANLIYQNKINSGKVWITNLITIAKYATDNVFQAWKDGKIKKSHALMMARRFKHKPEIQNKILDFVLNGKIPTSTFIKKFTNVHDTDKLLEQLEDLSQGKNKALDKIKLRQTYYRIWQRYKKYLANNDKAMIKEYRWLFDLPKQEDA